ncbi:hypothetical protein RvY_12296 [Ramazzottius varieornatus]|uniref:Uncharacterized protein n=1 Tax=Ramazzottius varieornatus TaxID=947166 RepID=A0A1D1VPF9_RAMVA|nr:hypothetical protein RvY_12296 [Ramazzottius varieornatus]
MDRKLPCPNYAVYLVLVLYAPSPLYRPPGRTLWLHADWAEAKLLADILIIGSYFLPLVQRLILLSEKIQ